MGRPPSVTMDDLRRRMRVAVDRCLAGGTPISRDSLRRAGFVGTAESVAALVNELIDSGVIRKEDLHANRRIREDWSAPVCDRPCKRDQQVVEIPPLRQHAPDAPTRRVVPDRSIWDWLREHYWSPRRRALYRRGAMS